MKYLFIFLMLFRFAHAQSLGEIGPFKLNKTTTKIIDSLIGTHKYDTFTVQSGGALAQHAGDTNSLIRLIVNPNDIRISPALTFIPKSSKTYHIPSIKIGQYTFKRLYLVFYHDTLIVFQCAYNSLYTTKLISLYGLPYQSKSTSLCKCTIDGVDKEIPEFIRYIAWEDKKNDIYCEGAYGDTYDFGCHKITFDYYYFFVDDKITNLLVEDNPLRHKKIIYNNN